MVTSKVIENFRLASTDPDYFGPVKKLLDEPLCYDDSRPLAGSIGYELNNITDEATQRATEAKLSSGLTVSILNCHCSQATGTHMPVKHASALKSPLTIFL